MFRNFTYPGSDFHELNLDFLLDMCCRFAGLRLDVQGDNLRLVNERDEVVSSVQVSYADKALKDIDGNMIQSYIISAGTSGDTIIFTKGDNSVTAITVPYANKAKYDVNSNEITDYVLHTQIAGDKLRITKGDGTIAELTIPYAVRATDDEEGNDITTYATTLAVDGNNVVLRDRKGRLLNSITVAYATKALQDADGNVIKTNYGSALQTGTTTVKLLAKDGSLLSEITVPYATEASHATNADFATLAEDANNAIETIAVVGDNIVFTTYDGVSTTVTCPYSVKALKDANSNEITKTYVADVTNNVNTGEITFYDAEGTAIVSITPQVEKAKKDTYNNLIADYIKQILVDVNSNYVTVVHGTGTTDSLIINYATKALNDLNDQAIHNTYISYIECVEDVDDGHYKLVCYDGDTPKAELFRFEVTAYSAQTDINGKDLTTYVADVDYNASKEIEVTDGGGNTLKTLANKLGNVADVNLTTPANGDVLTYDSNDDEWVNAPIQLALDDLTDVVIDSNTLADADVLTYDANAGEWQNKPASGGGDVIQVPYATNVALATCFHGTGYDLMALDIDLNLTCNPFMFQYPSISLGMSLVTDSNNETWQEFIIQDSNCLSYLPGAIVVGGKTFPISSSGNLFGYLTYSFLNPGTNNNTSEPNRHQNITIESVEIRNYDLNYNPDIPRVYIRGFVKTNTLYNDNADLMKYFVSTSLWSSQTDLTYFHVQGKAYSTLV